MQLIYSNPPFIVHIGCMFLLTSKINFFVCGNITTYGIQGQRRTTTFSWLTLALQGITGNKPPKNFFEIQTVLGIMAKYVALKSELKPSA